MCVLGVRTKKSISKNSLGGPTHVSHIRFLCPVGYARAKLPPNAPHADRYHVSTATVYGGKDSASFNLRLASNRSKQAAIVDALQNGSLFSNPFFRFCFATLRFLIFWCTREYRTKHLQGAARAGAVWDTSHSRVWLPCRSSAAPTSVSRSPRPFVVLRRAINAQRTRVHIIFTKSSTHLPGCVLIFLCLGPRAARVTNPPFLEIVRRVLVFGSIQKPETCCM